MAELKKGLNMGLVYTVVGFVLAVGSLGVGYIIAFTETIIPAQYKFVVVVLTLTINGVLVIFIAQNLTKLRRATPQV